MKKLILILILFGAVNTLFGQNSFAELEAQMDTIAKSRPGLLETTRIDISGLTLYDVITSIADEHELNVSVSNDLDQVVRTNLYDVPVRDVLLFLADNYELEVGFTSGIMTFSKRLPPPVEEEEVVLEPINVSYNPQNDFLSINLKNDSLPRVAERITELTDKNIVLAPDVKTFKVSAYLKNRPFDQVIEMMAKSNQLEAIKDDNGFYYLQKATTEADPTAATAGSGRRRSSRTATQTVSGSLEVSTNSNGFLKVKALEADLASIIAQSAEAMQIDYFFYNVPKDVNATLIVSSIGFEDLLDHLFKGTIYTYRVEDDLFVIGEQNTEGLRVTELIQMENRTIDNVIGTLPADLTAGIEVKEVIELNGIVASGSRPRIEELKAYLREIDLVVPMVQIEVLIVQYEKSYDVQTGLQALLGEQGQDVQTGGQVFPNTDVTLNATTINDLIEGFNGFGIFNLGKVTKDFYMNLSALENNSIIKLQSTPKVATLSGHDASISIGETSYYFEARNDLVGIGQNNQLTQSGSWKSTDASLSLNISPKVSKDEQVTLGISVEKSAFTGRVAENAPPGKTSQTFESLVRVRNNEMILLGGLDEVDLENSGTGTPFLSRIPVIKWFFSSKRKRKSTSKLHVFIKPTIVY
ncbi:type II secretion system protein GspD [Gilvibacter sp.]|uniref:type II secretion system protein GspD n=1 Tax=Gilvibacter sp. TaxID=2729997 RepID=UPI003F49B906